PQTYCGHLFETGFDRTIPTSMRLSALSRKQDPRTTATELVSFAQDVRRGLTAASQKALPPKYFYDDLGSALFEAITHLPEYGLTRAEDRILCANARHIARLLETPVVVAELGSGGGRKTGSMLRAITAEQPSVRYYPIDVS